MPGDISGQPVVPASFGPRGMSLARENRGSLIPMAVLVGAGVGAGAIAFRWLIEVCTLVVSGDADYSEAGHVINPQVPWLGPYFVVLAPVVAIIVFGPMVWRWAREARGTGCRK